MEMKQNIYHNSYTFSFFVLVVFVLFHHALSIDINTLSSSESLTISSNKTLVSPGGVFELGFFKPSSKRPHWYLGIWYKKVSEKTYAWVANRDKPLSTSTGTLKISGNDLVLLDQSNSIAWTTNLSRGNGNVRSPVIAELLSNGNFVVRYKNSSSIYSSGFLWQSFDFPTDTLLPEMKLGFDVKTGRNKFLTSWRSPDDPRSGKLTYRLQFLQRLPEFLLQYEDWILQRSGPWDGLLFSGIPEEQRSDYMVQNFIDKREEVSYSFMITNESIYSRFIIGDSTLKRFTWIPPSQGWSLSWNLSRDPCEQYAICGPNAYCDNINAPATCNCIRGFVPKDQADWDLGGGTTGCVRRRQLNCGGGDDVYHFELLNNIKLPDTKTASLDRRIDVKKCEEWCRSDCNCTSYAFINTELGCLIWTGELIDIRTYMEGGHDLYVKLYADDSGFSSGHKRDQTGKIIGWCIGGVSLMLILIVILFCFWKRRQKQAKADAAAPIACQVGNQVLMNEMVVLPRKKRDLSGEDGIEDLELPLIEFEDVVTATQHFSDFNKVGQGGFGVVYKV
ncbi:hypothetical protein N665_0634s0003 [Sinapis alba]|nr:hypothetical protein N665_0634s0003 [Sinapis alba]